MQTYDSAWVTAEVSQMVELWHESAGQHRADGRQYCRDEQAENEKAYDQELDSLERDLQRLPKSGLKQSGVENRIVTSFGRFSSKALNLDDEAVDLLTHEFLPVGLGLARWARDFDSALSMSDIIQAARNAWTAAGLQPLLGTRVRLTPSILGYSLLYPYSDNLLDDEGVSADEKLLFSRRFRRMLLGEDLPVRDDRERAIGALIALIETQYPRISYPQVFDCLLAIHQAQEHSMRQLQTGHDSLRLSCAKGGTSVLADACLAHGSLKREESRFAFEWGVLLQLGDDLQDVVDDMRRGSMTLFSAPAKSGRQLDNLTVQLLNFSQKVSNHMEELPHGSTSLKSLLKMSWRSLIIRAVADSHQFFSPRFLHEAERSSPFHFDFLRARKDRLASRQGLYAKLFNAFLEMPTPNPLPQLAEETFTSGTHAESYSVQ